MFLGLNKKHLKIIQIIFGGLFLLVLFGSFQFAVTNHHVMGTTIDCPFEPGQHAMCDNTPLEHVEEWQNLFTVLPERTLSFSLFLVLFALFILTRRGVTLRKLLNTQSFLSRTNKLNYFFDPIKEAFSSGILNPKIYLA